MDGSLSGSINGMDITPEGVHFVTGESGEKKRKPSPAYLNGAMDPAGGRLLEISTAGSKGRVVRFRLDAAAGVAGKERGTSHISLRGNFCAHQPWRHK